MINIILRSGTYTEMDLRRKISETIPESRDVTTFLDAMIATKQVTKYLNMYTLPVEKITFAEPVVLNWTTYKYGGGNRIGIRASLGWVEQYNYPHEMYLMGVYVDGRYILVDSFYFNKIWWNASTTPLKIVKPGGIIETWRMQIPKQILSNGFLYTLSPGTQIQTKLVSTVKEYWTELKLWGFVMSSQVTYDYDNPKLLSRQRHLELNGTNFINEFSVNIQSDADFFSTKIANIMKDLLDSNQEYLTVASDYFEENIIGCILEQPLMESESRYADVKLWGTQGGNVMGKIITKWITFSPMSCIPNALDFEVV